MKVTTILQPNGRVVIPAQLRQHLGLEAGHRLEITVEQGRIVLTPALERLRQAQALLAAHRGTPDLQGAEERTAAPCAEPSHD